jgi:hypothetical protein
MCAFPAVVRQLARSAFPYLALVEGTGPGKLDGSVQGASVSAERAEPTWPEHTFLIATYLLSVRDADTEPCGQQPRKGGRHVF